MKLRGPFLLGPDPVFPHPELAHESGLLAVGGDLSVERLLAAYSNGIFPWPLGDDDDALYWFSPDPRFVLYPSELHVGRSLARRRRSGAFEVHYDWAFEDVIEGCRQTPRPGAAGTWITPSLEAAYVDLHQLGIAHSAEAWVAGRLVGGLYGLALGRVFFGESMFHRETDASKVVFAQLVEDLRALGYRLVDCQQETDHLASLGARSISRAAFLHEIEAAIPESAPFPEG
ncbi:MAG: leucyl/phenylalanyl-tRNA--protein transferase [Acidobacteriota bacterium]|nr:leucyl/phenylalanyl-tRNA--protein transferase [Acidobacteriota bacterium]